MDQNNPKHKLTSTLFIEERESLYSRSLNVFDKGKTQSMVLMSSFNDAWNVRHGNSLAIIVLDIT